ncbi:MAG: hypothetical protein QHG99_03915 [Methanomicrobiales archaeon]|nr:hypothetical protein [Methanomicrobiales archaeon]
MEQERALPGEQIGTEKIGAKCRIRPWSNSQEATSPTIANVLLVAITIILAILVLLLFSLPYFSYFAEPPRIIEIKAIYHSSEIAPYQLNYDSRVVLLHNGSEYLLNDHIRAEIFLNGVRIPAVVDTLNGHHFIATRHYGVQWIGGSGCSGDYWQPGEKLVIDLADGTIHEQDEVRVDIIERATNRTISRDIFRQQGGRAPPPWRYCLPYPLNLNCR